MGPAWVGDMVMAQGLFKTLKQAEADVVIDVLAPSWSEPLLARMSEVRQSINLPVGHGRVALLARWRLGRRLRAQGYDQAIVIPRSFKAALVPFFARIPRRTGYRGEHRYRVINDMRPLDKSVLRQTAQRYVALGLSTDAKLPPSVPEPRLQVDAANADRLRKQLELDTNQPVIGLLPGAEYGPAKQWPVTHYADLAARWVARGYTIWILGSERDRPIADEIAAQSGRDLVNLCGKTRLEDAIDLLSSLAAVVTNDSGLMHIAAAVDVPLVAMYGSSTPDYTPPLTRRGKVLYLGLDCSPCFKRQCPLGHTHCLTELSVSMADDALTELLNNN